MFDKVFDRFGDFDFEKAIKVVDLVWDNRDKIMDLIERLPEMLSETGESMEAAGASAVKASNFLTGSDDSPGARELSNLAAEALDRCYSELRSVARVMDKLGNEIDDIRIPSIKPEYTEIANIRVIKGIDFGESQLVDNAAERLKGGSDRLDEIGKDLRNVAVQLRKLGRGLTDTGDDLNKVGVKLAQSGTTLRSYSGVVAPKRQPAAKPKSAPKRKRTTTRKPSPKPSDDSDWDVSM